MIICLLIFSTSFAAAQDSDPADLGVGDLGTASTGSGNPFGDIDVSQWQDYYDNPEAVTNCPNPAECQSMIDLLEGTEIDVDAYRSDLEGYLNRSDPAAVIGGVLASSLGVGAVCEPETGNVVQETTTTQPYSCHSGYEATDVVTDCQIPLNVSVDQDYQYSCNVPDETICTGSRLGGHYYRVTYITGEVRILDPDEYVEPGCIFLDMGSQDSFSVWVEYRCPSDHSFRRGGIVNIHQDCTTDTCDELETEGCRPSGDEYCTGEPGTTNDLVSCVPAGQSVDGLQCARERVHELEVYFTYECQYSLDPATGELRPDPKCVDLVGDDSCRDQGRECVQRAPHEEETVTCEVGDNLTYTEETCDVERYGVGYEEFLYSGRRVFNQATKIFDKDNDLKSIEASTSCRENEETCIVEAPEIFEPEVCRTGYRDVDTSYACEIKREVVVDADYIYGTRRTWNAAQNAHIAADSYRAGLAASCLRVGESCEVETEPQFEERVCLQGYRLNDSDETCNLEREVIVDTDYGYVGRETYYEEVSGADGSALFVRDSTYNAAVERGCTVLGRSCAEERPVQYEQRVCQVGYDYDVDYPEITRELVRTVETDYFYKAYSNYVEGQGFVDSAALNSLQATQTCELQSRVCTQESGGVFSTHECRVGYTETFENNSCEINRVVNTDSDYIYKARENWDSSQGWTPTSQLVRLHNASVCSRTNRTCVTPSPGVFENYTCEQGYRRTYRNQSFRTNATPNFDTDYYYTGKRTWNGSSHARDSQANSLASDNTCNLASSVCSSTTPPPFKTYTCRQGYEDKSFAMTCHRNRQITVDLDYSYTVDRVWSTSQNRWTSTSDWNRIRGSVGQAATCVRQSQTCASESPGVYSEHTCRKGYTIDPQNVSCQAELTFTVDKDYRYTGYETWNGSRFVRDTTLTRIDQQKTSKQCVRESVHNEQVVSTAERTSYYECIQGNITYSAEATCQTTLNVTVTPKYFYKYREHEFNSPLQFDNTCQAVGFIHIPKQCSWWDWGCNDRIDDEANFWVVYECSTTKPTSFNRIYMGARTEYVESDSVNDSACSSAKSKGPLKSQTCIQGRSTKTINGKSVTRDCWKWSRTYGSTKKDGVNTCVAPSGYSYVSESSYSGSPALGTARNLKKRKYRKIESVAGVTNRKSAYTCFTGYWLTSSGARRNYSCSPPAGSTLRGNDCAFTDSAGTCRLWSRSYSVPVTGMPSGGYKRHREVWRCEDQVTGSGVASPQILRARKNWVYWQSNNCPAKTSGFSNGCSLKSQGYVGSAKSKTVDGLTLNRQWTYQYNYVCQQRHNIDTCSSMLSASNEAKSGTQFASLETGPAEVFKKPKRLSLAESMPDFPTYDDERLKAEPAVMRSGVGAQSPPKIYLASQGDWTLDGQRCVNYENGSCTLWEKDYLREENDPSGGCHVQKETWRCEEAVSSVGTATIHRAIETEKWEWPSSDCQNKLAQYDSCVYRGQAYDYSTGGTRTINGLSVNRSSWVLKRNYTCTNRIETDTCNPPSNASVKNVRCLWSDSSGICRLSDYTYHIPLPDPTGGCTTYTDTYLCENRNHGTPTNTRTEFTHMTYTRSAAHNAVRANATCRQTNTVLGGGQSARTVNGISVRPSGSEQWHRDEHYRCYSDQAINTCNVPNNSTLQSTTCTSRIDGGACSLNRFDYKVTLPDPSGGCHAYEEEFLCSDPVSNVGQPVAVPTKVTSTPWNWQQCDVYRNDNSCQYKGRRCVEGPETRNINGVNVYFACWRYDYDYECVDQNHINTCSPKPTATLDEETCLYTDRGGVCRLFERTYVNEEHDPSGGCHQWENKFLCENQVSGLSHYDTHKYVSSQSWDPENYYTMRRQYQSCKYVSGSYRNDGVETRTVDGLEITGVWDGYWTYECYDREYINTCQTCQNQGYIEASTIRIDHIGNYLYVAEIEVWGKESPSGPVVNLTNIYRSQLTATQSSVYRGRDYLGPHRFIDGNNNTYALMNSTGEEWVQLQFPQSVLFTSLRVHNVPDNRDWVRRRIQGAVVTLKNGGTVAHTFPSLSGSGHSFDLNVDTDSTGCIPEESIYVSETCGEQFGTTCVLAEKTYNIPIADLSGGCNVYETQYRCEDELAGHSTYTEWKNVISESYDSSACQSMVAGFHSCSLNEQSCSSGAQTRTIDGLEVTRDCWELERDYTCKTQEQFDTCTVPSNALNIERNCAWSDAGGTCRLFEAVYDVELPDPTGGCTTFLEEFRCEDQRSGSELLDTVRHVESTRWDSSACGGTPEGSTCRSFTQTCSTHASNRTRNINGLDVTYECWEYDRHNPCTRRDSYDECKDLTHLGTPEQICLWQDAQGVCRLYERTYQRPVEDGSGGCHVWEKTAWCGEISQLDEDAHKIFITETRQDFSDCNVIADKEGALLDATSCTSSGTGPRAPPYVVNRSGAGEVFDVSSITEIEAVSESCWAEERTYRIEHREPVNTCVGQINSLCELDTKSCVGVKERNGTCAKERLDYTCGIEGTDVCELEDATFRCLGPSIPSTAQLNNLNGNLISYSPVKIEAEVVRSYFDNNACTEATSFGTCRKVGETCTDPAGALRRPERAQDDYYQQFVGYAPTQHHSCWEMRSEYDCTPPDNVSYCPGDIGDCTLGSSSCLFEGDEGCEMNVNHFTCEGGSTGVCGGSGQNYICDDPVDGHEPTGELDPTITSEYDLSQCDAVENEQANCLEPEVVCSAPERTRYYETTEDYWHDPLSNRRSDYRLEYFEGAVPVTSDCFEYTRSYQCTELSGYTSDCEVPDNCESTGDECLGYDPSGNCLTTEHNYTCTSTEEEIISEGRPGTCEPYHEPGDAHSPSNGPNANINALASLMGMAQADHEYGPQSTRIFDGTDRRCKRDVLGVTNCCKDSGLLLNLGLSSCSSSEVELAVQKEENRCIYVGSYCAKKAFFGVCLRKKQTYCCYQAEIGKVIAEAGREQLGENFGSPKEPVCEGFTVDEFQRLNLDNVDWSSVTADIMSDLDIGDDTTSLQDQLTNSINNMIGGGGG